MGEVYDIRTGLPRDAQPTEEELRVVQEVDLSRVPVQDLIHVGADLTAEMDQISDEIGSTAGEDPRYIELKNMRDRIFATLNEKDRVLAQDMAADMIIRTKSGSQQI
ncbi:hypothetical protein HYU82_00100 [Candidatus Saccharibacteria bacterium]|nr:hypothetical protein [Candidatus Saccharibacteria bacterium]